LRAVASLLPIVLSQSDLRPAGAHHDAEQRAVVFPSLVDREAERFIERDALLQIVDRQAGNDAGDLQSLLSCCHDLPPARIVPTFFEYLQAPRSSLTACLFRIRSARTSVRCCVDPFHPGACTRPQPTYAGKASGPGTSGSRPTRPS